MMAPGMIEGAGTKLRIWGENTPAAIEAFRGPKATPAVEKPPIRISGADAIDRALAEAKDIPKPKGPKLTPFEEELLARSTSSKPAMGPKAIRISPANIARAEDIATNTPAPVSIPVPKEGLDFPTAEKPLQVNVPATKSKSPNATVPQLSENDVDSMVEILQRNPGISKEEALNELLTQRAQRNVQYRDTAGLSRLEQSALDRDLE